MATVYLPADLAAREIEDAARLQHPHMLGLLDFGEAGGSDAQDLPEDAVAAVARKVGAGRVLQGSIVGPADHLVVSASLVSVTDGRTLTQTSVAGPRDSLFVHIDEASAVRPPFAFLAAPIDL